jgi:glutamate--cysteine ligase
MEIIKKLKAFENHRFKGLIEFNRGIERETLRILPNGELSQSSHPKPLGSALANPHITTDFSESQLEFITPYFLKNEETLSFLKDIHDFFYSKVSGELLWPSSMPCKIDSQKEIPIADYGSSNLGKLKKIYRIGLKNRYGSNMQAISGLHYNFSFENDFWDVFAELENSQVDQKDFISKKYFSLMRNFHRYGWIILYFFGASPVLHKSFGGSSSNLQKFDDEGTLFLPQATSLRMSDLGYQNKSQKELEFCFNSLDTYIEKIDQALKTIDSKWEKIGVKVNGEYRQMNDKVLQIENEFYGFIRPKRFNKLKNIRPNKILREEGVQYLEVRAMDLNPFSPLGITFEQTKFLDILLVFCALKESPLCSNREIKIFKSNWVEVAKQGRNPNLILKKGKEELSLKDWALEIYSEMKLVSKILDEAQETEDHNQVMEKFYDAIMDSSKTFSGQLIKELQEGKKTFLDLHLEKAIQYKQDFSGERLSAHSMEFFENAAKKSIEDQNKLEKDLRNFDSYLAEYLAN